MKILSWLLAALLLSQLAKADPSALPETYQESDWFYRIVSHFFDVGASIEKLGVKVYACRLENGPTPVNHRAIGACLLESADYTFKTHKSATIWIWVLNSEGQYLPPAKMEWKNTHTGWFNFASEFLFLARDKGRQRRSSGFVHNANSSKEVEDCEVTRTTETDLGNFIGDLVITVPPGRKVSEYFVITALDLINVEKLTLNAKMPFYQNRKKNYKISATLLDRKAETISVSLFTDFNLITQRDYCASGTITTTGRLPIALVKP